MYEKKEHDSSKKLTLPSNWKSMYEDLISQNAGLTSQIEGTLRSLTYIIPGRFRDSEIAAESLHSGVQMLSLYHDSLLAKVYARLPASIPRPLPTSHHRYTQFWSSSTPRYQRVAFLLQTVTYTELPCEMVAKRRGERTRWRIVVLLEMIKAICRLILMSLTRSRPSVSPPLPGRETDPRANDSTADSSSWDGLSPAPAAPTNTPWTMPRTGLTLPCLPDASDITDFLLAKVLRADDIKPAPHLLPRLATTSAQIAELAWILRPVLYALMMLRWRNERRAWTPWLVGVGVDLAARQLARHTQLSREGGSGAGGWSAQSGLEREEWARRGWSLGWWAMRGAFYEHVTRGWIRGVTSRLKGKMLLDMVGGIIEDYDYLWEEYHFSTATM